VIERGQGEAGVFGRAEAPADDATGVAIHHDREVLPAGGDFQVGDVTDPDLIRPCGQAVELAIVDARKEPVQPGDAAIELQRAGAETRLAQEPADASAAHPHT
jgi:hypothetical protein